MSSYIILNHQNLSIFGYGLVPALYSFFAVPVFCPGILSLHASRPSFSPHSLKTGHSKLDTVKGSITDRASSSLSKPPCPCAIFDKFYFVILRLLNQNVVERLRKQRRYAFTRPLQLEHGIVVCFLVKTHDEKDGMNFFKKFSWV